MRSRRAFGTLADCERRWRAVLAGGSKRAHS
jgi:hypothetical protein